MLSFLISLLILFIIFGIISYIVSLIPIPPQFVWIVRLIVAVTFLVALIELLTGGLGHGTILLR